MSREKESSYPRPPLPSKPNHLGEARWPPPTPLPIYPSEDVIKALQQILTRLDRIEKRLENIEKLLLQRQSTP